MVHTQNHRLKRGPQCLASTNEKPKLTMLYYVIEIDAKRCFPHCGVLPFALIPLGITTKERAKRKNKKFIMIPPSFFEISFPFEKQCRILHKLHRRPAKNNRFTSVQFLVLLSFIFHFFLSAEKDFNTLSKETKVVP